MEHLASNGYVILSIAHPYQSLKVNLPSAGTVTLTSDLPQDTGFDIRSMERGLGSKIRRELSSSALEYSPTKALILELVDKYAVAETQEDRELVVENALELDALKPYLHLMTRESLGEYLRYVHGYQHRQIEYWVEDTQFVADEISEIYTVVDGLSEVLDTTEFGVFGMSFGGSAAGEFCKIDSRCQAGVNLDGTQFGRHWDLPLNAPFLMFYSEEHQGGNDYAYMPPRTDYREYTVRQSTHVDFLDLAYTHPILKTLGAGGEIEGERMMEILNIVSLDFFNEFLKGKSGSNGVYDDIPELLVRDNITAGSERVNVY
ncbi:MAG: hypothetical protein DHS20C12_06490 [Pseudohongiella sp.]|nr:MAG: hypothetical protein DHS20C12_06490 [Pseudohongiella sp.]